MNRNSRRRAAALLAPLLALALWALTAPTVEAAKPAPASSCVFANGHVTCTVTLDTRGRTPDLVTLQLLPCAGGLELGFVSDDTVSKGDTFTIDREAATPARLIAQLRSSRFQSIAYLEDDSLCGV